MKDVQPIKTTDQCKLVKLTVACASDALDGRIKAHLNLIEHSTWWINFLRRLFEALF